MSNTNRVDMYVSDSMLNRIENEAEQANKSRSKYLRDILQGHWDDQDLQRLNDDLQLEEKVERIAADARDELTRIAESVEQRNNDVADMTARAGVYSIANFELLKATHSLSEKRKKNSLLTGSRRLREPLDDHSDLDAENGGEDGNEENEELSDAVTETFVENENRSAADEFFEGRGRSKEEAEKTQWPVDDDTDDETENETDDDSGGIRDGFFDRWA